MGTKSHFQSREKYFIMEYNRKYCEKCYSHFGVESIYWKIMSNLAYLSTFHCMKHMWVMPSLRSGKRFKSQTQNTKDQAGKKKRKKKKRQVQQKFWNTIPLKIVSLTKEKI